MRITLVISSLTAGGAERVMTIMANYWAAKGWGITLLTMDSGKDPFYKLHPDVLYCPLGTAGISSNTFQSVKNNIRRIRVLRKAIVESAPQAVISFIDQVNIITILATIGLCVPMIVSERIDPAYHSIGKVWNILRNIFYPLSSGVVVQTENALKFFPPSVRRLGKIIPNPVAVPDNFKICSGKETVNGEKVVMAMGRLCEQKGFDILLKAFSVVAPNFNEWKLIIWGEGHLRQYLENLNIQLGLKGRVFLPGRTKEPYVALKSADLFVMSSLYEGFPNALCEAMALGVPVISTDCPSGPGEIIRDGLDGVLVPPGDVDALAGVLERLMSDEKERKRIAARAPEVIERFGLEKVMGIWESLLGGFSK